MENYWNEIKNQLKFYADRVFYLPLDEIYLKKIEAQIHIKFPEIYFEFLKEFGFTQDFIPEISQTEDSLVEDLAYVRECCPDFFPICIDEVSDEIWLLKRDSSDDTIFLAPFDEESDIIPTSKGFNFRELITRSLNKVKQEYHSRTKNINKVRICEFRIEIDNFNIIINLLNKKLATRWLDRHWKDKYKPNIFGIEVALFEIDGQIIVIEREDDNDDSTVYFFEIEESVTGLRKLNKGQIIKDILEANDIDFEFTDYGIIEIEE
jgi:hypothetical protein